MPLPTDVGDAIAAYLRQRPARALGHTVFVRLLAPLGPLSTTATTQIVAAAAQRAGLGRIHAHRLRHFAATHLLSAGAPLSEIGLLVVTGMRVGEAIALDRRDFDAEQDLVTVRQGKFDKSRALPLHPTATTAVRQYLRRSDRPVTRHSAALFVSTAGTRLLCRNVQQTFGALVRRAGLVPHSAACRPRLHDLRHRFAVCTLLDAYRQGHDPEARIARLATYLGHVDPKYTYWYLSAAPELMQLAADRLEHHPGGSA